MKIQQWLALLTGAFAIVYLMLKALLQTPVGVDQAIMVGLGIVALTVAAVDGGARD